MTARTPFRYWRRFEPTTRPDQADTSSIKFVDDDAHLAAVLAALPEGFPVLATERFRAA